MAPFKDGDDVDEFGVMITPSACERSHSRRSSITTCSVHQGSLCHRLPAFADVSSCANITVRCTLNVPCALWPRQTAQRC